MIARPSWTNGCNRFFKFITVRPWQPMKLDGEAAKQEVSPFLSNPLTYRNQTWNIDSWHHPGMAMCLMSCILSPWLSVQAAYLLGPRNAACSFNYYSSFFCHGMSMAAHRTVCQKVVKFGTQVKDSYMFNFTQLHVANKHALAPPMGQSFRYICAHITFDPLARFSKRPSCIQTKLGS